MLFLGLGFEWAGPGLAVALVVVPGSAGVLVLVPVIL